MIPKIIHYCWFGPNRLSSKAKKCIESWKIFFPDYKIMFWDENNSPINYGYAKEAYNAKKYAFVADYVRTWALYKYGGIYFDTDVLVVKQFPQSLLDSDVFLAYEQKEKLYVNVAVWGAGEKTKFVEEVLRFYDNCHFDVNNIFKLTIPNIVTEILQRDVQTTEKILALNYDVFYPFPQKKRRTSNYMKYATENTLAIHLWDFSWLTLPERIKEHIKMFHNFIFHNVKNLTLLGFINSMYA